MGAPDVDDHPLLRAVLHVQRDLLVAARTCARRLGVPGLHGLGGADQRLVGQAQLPGDPARDFIIAEESAKGFSGLINLIGIESPGLTASPAIARHVAALVAAHE